MSYYFYMMLFYMNPKPKRIISVNNKQLLQSVKTVPFLIFINKVSKNYKKVK